MDEYGEYEEYAAEVRGLTFQQMEELACAAVSETLDPPGAYVSRGYDYGGNRYFEIARRYVAADLPAPVVDEIMETASSVLSSYPGTPMARVSVSVLAYDYAFGGGCHVNVRIEFDKAPGAPWYTDEPLLTVSDIESADARLRDLPALYEWLEDRTAYDAIDAIDYGFPIVAAWDEYEAPIVEWQARGLDREAAEVAAQLGRAGV